MPDSQLRTRECLAGREIKRASNEIEFPVVAQGQDKRKLEKREPVHSPLENGR